MGQGQFKTEIYAKSITERATNDARYAQSQIYSTGHVGLGRVVFGRRSISSGVFPSGGAGCAPSGTQSGLRVERRLARELVSVVLLLVCRDADSNGTPR